MSYLSSEAVTSIGAITATSDGSSGGRLCTADGRTLPLRGAALYADAKGGLIQVRLEQRFFNPHAEPLEVSYLMPLPADAAVSGFQFRLGDQLVVGMVDTKQKAKQRFEEAIVSGRTAALLDEERSSLFTQRVGNIPPGLEVVCELTIDQRLKFLPDGQWEWRFPSVAAPRYQGAEGRVSDGAKVTVDVADRELPVRLSLQLSVRDPLPEGVRPGSPSHTLHTQRGVQRSDITFADEAGAALDRDVVVRWRAVNVEPTVSLDAARLKGATGEAAYGLVTLVPPSAEAAYASVPRDLIILLDTSGSMSGEPLAQARRVASALVDSLTDDDFLEIIEFSTSARRWKWRPVKASPRHRKDALSWLAKLSAGGGTEMRSGILEALSPLRKDAQRQVVLMTDGLIGFENEVVRTIVEQLPANCRVHTVGIGSGVNRSLTSPAARAGRGVEQIIGLGEDAERAAQRVLAHTVAPQVTQVTVSGSAVLGTASEWVNDLYAGSPTLVPVQLSPRGGEVVVHGRTAHGGDFVRRLAMAPIEPGEGNPSIAKLYARERVEDLELKRTVSGQTGAFDAEVTALGLQFQISTRLTSWVAVSEEATVDPRAPRRKTVMPQQLPYGMSAEGLGLRAASFGAPQAMASLGAAGGAPARSAAARPKGAASFEVRAKADGLQRGGFDDEAAEPAPEADEAYALHEESEGAAPPPPAPAAPAGRSAPRRERPAPEPKLEQRLEKRRGPERRLKARLYALPDGRFALELTVVDAPLSWEPLTATVQLASGATMAAAIDFGRTTMALEASVGMTLTLVIEAPSTPVGATVQLRDGELQLEIE